MRLDITDLVCGVSALLSVALYFYTRKSRRSPKFILDLGLVYMVLTAASLGLIAPLGGVPQNIPIFPPDFVDRRGRADVRGDRAQRPAKMLVAGLIAASMDPLGMLIAKARGIWDFGPLSNVLVMHYPDYLLVGVAVVISHVVTRLGQQVAKAREMGSYQLGELLGRGGMGEVYRATHRMLARPAAIKLIRPEVLGGDGRSTAQTAIDAIPARGGGRGQPAVAAHRRALRLRRHRGRDALLRDGAAGGDGPRVAGAAARARCRRRASSTSCARSASRWRRPTPRVWSTATSSRPTSTSAGSACSTIS